MSSPRGRIRASCLAALAGAVASGCVPRPVALARSLLGDSDLRLGARDLRDDCSGLVTGCYAAAGIDLLEGADPLAPSGTAALHGRLERAGRLFRDRRPRPGDLVFFDDTWDADRDGRRGDRLTHVGVVERVLADGVVVFLHYVSGAARRGRMDPSRPDTHRDPTSGEVVNDYLRRAATPGEPRRLAGELFVAYGTP